MSIQPREYDAVLGSNNTAAPTDAVLGGIEGVKRRLAMGDIQSRIIALSQALNYGEAGLDVVIQALQDPSKQIQWSAYGLLARKTETKVEQALLSFSLISEAGIDYRSLQYILASQKLKKAYEILTLYTIKRRAAIPWGLNAPEGNLPSICEFGGGELLSWYEPRNRVSNMGFNRTDGYRKWSKDSFFGAKIVACFLKRIQACPEIP